MIAELSSLGVVRIEGADASTFLQAHFCNDVAAVAVGGTQISGYCSPKGRLLSLFHLHRLPAVGDSERLLMVVPQQVLKPMIDRLSMFAKMAKPAGKQMFAQVTRTDVTLSDSSDSLRVLGFTGSLELPEQSAPSSEGWPDLMQLATGGAALATASRRYIVGSELALDSLRQSLPATVEQGEESDWALADIRAGLPAVVAATQDKFVPQMVNLQLIDGLSFTKGCYPGQEIVARMQYLGTLKRRMERAASPEAAVEPGTPVVDADGNTVGEVVMAAAAASGSELLMVCRIAALDAPLLLPSGAALTPLPLPYAFEDASDTGS